MSGEFITRSLKYSALEITWDDPNDEPPTYLISNFAAKNIEEFQARHGRMPRGSVETLAAMLHGAESEV